MHIKQYFESKKILHKDKALQTGDYCMCITACDGFPVDTYFTDELFIERKNSLSELAGSINDETFHYELKRALPIKHKFLLVEQPDGWNGIINHNYINDYNPKSFWGALHTCEIKYGLNIKFIKPDTMGLEIYSICKAVLDSLILK